MFCLARVRELFDAETDRITEEQRGSKLIERVLDPEGRVPTNDEIIRQLETPRIEAAYHYVLRDR